MQADVPNFVAYRLQASSPEMGPEVKVEGPKHRTGQPAQEGDSHVSPDNASSHQKTIEVGPAASQVVPAEVEEHRTMERESNRKSGASKQDFRPVHAHIHSWRRNRLNLALFQDRV